MLLILWKLLQAEVVIQRFVLHLIVMFQTLKRFAFKWCVISCEVLKFPCSPERLAFAGSIFILVNLFFFTKEFGSISKSSCLFITFIRWFRYPDMVELCMTYRKCYSTLSSTTYLILLLLHSLILILLPTLHLYYYYFFLPLSRSIPLPVYLFVQYNRNPSETYHVHTCSFVSHPFLQNISYTYRYLCLDFVCPFVWLNAPFRSTVFTRPTGSH